MNYQKIYDSLIQRSKIRTLSGYSELHHIIPKCMGGSDDNHNLARLTPEEHYLAHQLLIRIHPLNTKLIYAAAMMIPNRPTNKMYGWLKRKLAKAKSIEQSGSGNSQFGSRWCHNPITKENKKIRGRLPNGWVFGRYKELKEPIPTKTSVKRKLDTQKYSEYYEIYKQVGFEKFVELTNYQYSKQNLVQRFSKLLDNFEPQNGKKRG